MPFVKTWVCSFRFYWGPNVTSDAHFSKDDEETGYTQCFGQRVNFSVITI